MEPDTHKNKAEQEDSPHILAPFFTTKFATAYALPAGEYAMMMMNYGNRGRNTSASIHKLSLPMDFALTVR